MKRTIAKFIGIFGGVFLLFYFGACVYGNVMSDRNTIKPATPPTTIQAPYRLTIANTGNVILAKEVQQIGKVYLVTGWYDLQKGKYVYHSDTLKLDQGVFGTITLARRIQTGQ